MIWLDAHQEQMLGFASSREYGRLELRCCIQREGEEGEGEAIALSRLAEADGVMIHHGT